MSSDHKSPLQLSTILHFSKSGEPRGLWLKMTQNYPAELWQPQGIVSMKRIVSNLRFEPYLIDSNG